MFKVIFTKSYKSKLILNEIAHKNWSHAYPGYKNTFQYRILDYLENSSTSQQALPVKSIQYTDNSVLNSSTDSKDNLIMEDLYKSISCLSDLNDKYHKIKLAQEVYAKCFQIVDNLSPNEILNLLNTLFKVVPSKTASTHFYKESILILLKAVENGLLNQHQIVQLLFFMSLKKDTGTSNLSYLLPYLPKMESLSLVEQCIVAQSLYKLSTKLPCDELEIVRNVVEEQFERLIKDSYYLATLCKLLIMSDTNNDQPLECLSKAVIKYNQDLSFNVVANILRLYAFILTHETAVMNRLVPNGINCIEKDIQKFELDITDIDVFLWSTSFLGFTLSNAQKKLLILYFKLRLNEYKKRRYLGSLINTILFLHMHNISDTEEIINNCLIENIFDPILSDEFHWKVKSNFYLLLHQISLDMNIKFPPKFHESVKVGFVASKNVYAISEIAKKIALQQNINKVAVECPIASLMIPGVTLSIANNKYHIDVLDNTTCLRNTNIPHGFMNFKLHLLSRLKYKKILIPGEIFNKDAANVHFEIEQRIINSVNKSSTLDKKSLVL